MDFMEPNRFKTANRSRGIAFLLCCILLDLGGSSACDMASYVGMTPEEKEQSRRFYQYTANQSSTIFLGNVERISLIPSVLERGSKVYRINFRVLRIWKGSFRPGSLIILKMLEPSSMCGPFLPEVNNHWIIWLKKNTRELDDLSDSVSYSKFWNEATLVEVLEAYTTQFESIKK
jgi:hypothetical protein